MRFPHQAEGDSRGRIDDFKEYHTVSCPQPARIQSCYISAQSYTSHLLVSFWSALTSKTWRFVLSFWRTCYNTDSTGHWYIGSFFGFREGLDTSETSFFGSLGWRNKSALPYNHLHCTYWTESCLLRKILSPWHGFFEFIFFWWMILAHLFAGELEKPWPWERCIFLWQHRWIKSRCQMSVKKWGEIVLCVGFSRWNFHVFSIGKVTLFRDKNRSKTSVRPWRMKALKRRCGYMTLPEIHGIEGEGNW